MDHSASSSESISLLILYDHIAYLSVNEDIKYEWKSLPGKDHKIWDVHLEGQSKDFFHQSFGLIGSRNLCKGKHCNRAEKIKYPKNCLDISFEPRKVDVNGFWGIFLWVRLIQKIYSTLN